MAFVKLSPKVPVAHDNPEALFRDLRARRVQGLHTQQGDMLRRYVEQHAVPDIALELPTGSGKTLVGLLIAEWRRLKFQERCMLLCPTIQLVNQVVEQAKEKYGIDVVGFVGSAREYKPEDVARFNSGSVVGVTNYSTLFNSNPSFSDVSTLIFDDAHAAENYVAKCWSIEVLKRAPVFEDDEDHRPVFSALVDVIEKHVSDQDRLKFRSDEENPLDGQWVNKLPAPAFHKIREQIIAILDGTREIKSIYYPLKLLRDHLHACNIFYTASSILIRTITPPTSGFDAFNQAKQRIYMSATLGEGGDLERIFGRAKIVRIPAPTGLEKQGIGRRFILFPMRQVSDREAEKYAVSWIAKFERCLILTPSEPAANAFRKLIKDFLFPHGYQLFDAKGIVKSKKNFTSEKAVAVLANRYDGIELIENECRYQIVSGLPEATNLQERFLMSRMGAAAMYKVRIRTRVTQAVGRCTRSAIDWALVVILGDKISNYLLKSENRQQLHPELQAELEFGIAQSSTNLDEIETNIDHFAEQSEEWRAAEASIIEMRDQLSRAEDPVTMSLANSVSSEVEYADYLWRGDFARAVELAQNVVSHLENSELGGYKAWWLYLAGNAALLAYRSGEKEYKATAMDLYDQAGRESLTLPWLRLLRKQLNSEGIQATSGGEADDLAQIVENMERELEHLGKINSYRLESAFRRIRSGLQHTKDAAPFEQAQVELGKLLGYEAYKNNDESAPDPFWIMTESKGLVFEDYSAPQGTNPRIGKGKILQAKGHADWLKTEHPDIEFKVVFCAATKETTKDSSRFKEGVAYLHTKDMITFAEDALRVIRELWGTYTTRGDMEWRKAAAEKLVHAKLTPADVLRRLTAVPLEQAGK